MKTKPDSCRDIRITIHTRRAAQCQALAVLLNRNGYLDGDKMPTLQDWMALSASELAANLPRESDFADYREQCEHRRIAQEILSVHLLSGA